MSEQQSSQLLPGLFEGITEEQRITVLHLGPVMPETVAFFSAYRCKLYINDLFAELPLVFQPGDEQTVAQRVAGLLDIPAGVTFDLCLFWDLFNYLDEAGVRAVMDCLRDRLAPGARAHAFGVHNTRAARRDGRYALVSAGQICVRPRAPALPCYSPHPQARLQECLDGFAVKRSVLLAESRLELLLAARS
ncbi:hypothetical protein DWB85_07310 [Seongchinamella sediminis]|uniref:Uncharacterized protein n=1 Tax=Seongchinamella sediminis TaxID=2283635 RepID=A0A3L7E0U6_9GAMM|nr:hypothetical protein [Seongchinamella sediminis]RLQ22420.1 hypothetical protein DWB85_07310 [Seongchinamella sediminis]